MKSDQVQADLSICEAENNEIIGSCDIPDCISYADILLA